MAATSHQMSITLPDDVAAQVRARVASGKYASEIDVICDGLLALEDREMTVEQWLRTEVADIYDEMKADPGRGLTVEQVKASLAEDRRRRAG